MIDISRNDTWEVTWGGMFYNDIEDSSTMQPRYSEIFLTVNEARLLLSIRGWKAILVYG